MGAKSTCKQVALYWRQFVIIITPLVLLPLLLHSNSDEVSRCAYTLLLMAVYWGTEAIPLAVTSLLPAVLFPLLGTMSTSAVAAEYTKNTILMNIGSITMAIAFEKTNLHRRVALGTMSVIGTEPRWLMLGFMLPTWFLSMWISNTSTTALMIPLFESVLLELEKTGGIDIGSKKRPSALFAQEAADTTYKPQEKYTHVSEKVEIEHVDVAETELAVSSFIDKEPMVIGHIADADVVDDDDVEDDEAGVDVPMTDPEEPAAARNTPFAKGLVLCVAYSANVGGISTVTGSGTNIVMQGFAEELWGSHGLRSPVNFSSWMIFGLPLSILIFIIMWFILQAFFIGFCKKNQNEELIKAKSEATKRVIKDEYKKLGPFTYGEGVVSVLFAALILLWFFRDPDFLRGWATYFKPGYVGGSVSALLIAALLYAIPFAPPWRAPRMRNGRIDTLMDWEFFNKKMPWRVILILGGGFALAKGVIDSGLGNWLGEVLTSGPTIPNWLMVLCLSLLASALTEFTSNSATCTILMPIVANMAERMGMNPLYLMFPVAISTSCSFMLPVGTPPNTLAYSTGRVTILDMCKTGVVLNIICAFCITLATQTWGYQFFDFSTMPWPSEFHNTTATTAATFLVNRGLDA